jgi:hypothetical protein
VSQRDPCFPAHIPPLRQESDGGVLQEEAASRVVQACGRCESFLTKAGPVVDLLQRYVYRSTARLLVHAGQVSATRQSPVIAVFTPRAASLIRSFVRSKSSRGT